MIPALDIRGFGHGSGLLSPDQSRFVVNIPKNASSFIQLWAEQNRWSAALWINHPNIKEVMIVLRDPVDRWISGIAQYLNGFILNVHGPNGPIFPGDLITDLDLPMNAEHFIKQYTGVTERLVFDVISRFDDHVWPQWEILQGLPECERKWFLLDDKFESKFSTYLRWQIRDDLNRNQGSTNMNIKILQDFFRKKLQIRPELAQRVRRHYQKDYDLIAQVIHD